MYRIGLDRRVSGLHRILFFPQVGRRVRELQAARATANTRSSCWLSRQVPIWSCPVGPILTLHAAHLLDQGGRLFDAIGDTELVAIRA